MIAIPDGDVAAAVQCCLPESELDLLYGIGGAPEGVVAGAAVRALGGDMQARLIPRNQVKGNSPENLTATEKELLRCNEMNVPVNTVLKLEDLVRDDNIVFVATGITSGELLKGLNVEAILPALKPYLFVANLEPFVKFNPTIMSIVKITNSFLYWIYSFSLINRAFSPIFVFPK